jgi:hypothetical protein
MAKRVKFVKEGDEMVRVDDTVDAYCDNHGEWQRVPTVTDNEGTHLCSLCGYCVIWTNMNEIKSNERR